MQWRRRHCCAHTAKCILLLSLLGLLVFLVHHVWLTQFTGMPRWRGYPVVYGGAELHSTKPKGNLSAPHSAWRFVIVPHQKSDANVTSPEEGVSSPQGDPRFENTLAANTSQSVEGDLRVTISQGPFPYVINEPNKCADSRPSPFLVLLISTEARQVEARNAIRQTWGNESVAPALGFIRLFLLGRNEGELGLLQQRMLEAESQRYHDIIQQDFLDTYKNLTIKTLMGMNWVAIHCPQAGYVMKTDSDMFLNTEYLIYKLLRPELKLKKNYFTGNNMRGFAPNRNKNSKWYMPPELYPGEKYPTFCSGTGYVFSGDLAGKIYRASLRIRLLHLEDVYVGICLAKLQIEPTPPPNEFLFNHWRVSYSSCKYSHLITSHGFHPNELLKYWHHLQSNKRNTCINVLRAGRVHLNRMNRERPAK
ncbi:beta-1,3-galactosyltransferase 2-like isoform X1 [Cyclopterus lumpus]|uniref:beta-1,3-galactosyltransferase 2-like isoform X1 n=2 Tax=Cyclopterus lumpus TaxID=8103 RepID=UPI001487131D|nr:beta-1,3-galactosyltransferase 2-like isoform X1 [Cyclopterus lumpus]XP_034411507.1 beta-1,3-galactosyltransferase 2-like isoform X1 [Cyclopterus lumpus]XP_034411508.1 beta-1,3-galactosyltransferase 2-like isoform X1 [Cyclopterus lumpus]